jgi:hypothetical protein
VFKRHKGITPAGFPDQPGASRTQREVQPKTVYFDRLDFSHGSPTHRISRRRRRGHAALSRRRHHRSFAVALLRHAGNQQRGDQHRTASAHHHRHRLAAQQATDRLTEPSTVAARICGSTTK